MSLVGAAALGGWKGLAAAGALELDYEAQLVCGLSTGFGEAAWKLGGNGVATDGAVFGSQIFDEWWCCQFEPALFDGIDYVLVG